MFTPQGTYPQPDPRTEPSHRLGPDGKLPEPPEELQRMFHGSMGRGSGPDIEIQLVTIVESVTYEWSQSLRAFVYHFCYISATCRYFSAFSQSICTSTVFSLATQFHRHACRSRSDFSVSRLDVSPCTCSETRRGGVVEPPERPPSARTRARMRSRKP